jgi:predicted Zn-dependent protease
MEEPLWRCVSSNCSIGMVPHTFEAIPEAAGSVREAKGHLNLHHLTQVEIDQQNHIAQVRHAEKVEQQQLFESEFQALTFFNEFQQEMDEKSIKIDIALRQATKMQNLDLDKEFGIERKSKNLFTKSLRSLDDRNLRMQSMVSILLSWIVIA